MTKAEKYIKEELVNTGGERFIYEFTKWLQDNGISRIENERINQLLSKFLTSTVKPSLSEDEKVILMNIGEHKWIGRDNDSDLYLQNNCRLYINSAFGHLFQFIQPRRRI